MRARPEPARGGDFMIEFDLQKRLVSRHGELAFSAAQGATAQTTPGNLFQLRYGLGGLVLL